MIRRATFLSLATALLWAQSARDTHRARYQAWRQAAPALEQDAAQSGPNLIAQAQASADAAQAFFSARADAYSASGVSPAQREWLRQPLARPDRTLAMPAEVQQLVAVSAARVSTNITSFADDRDPAIRQVRQAMERERAALRALTESMNVSKASLTEFTEASDQADVQRSAVNQGLEESSARATQLAELVRREAASWAQYYKDLIEGATGAARPTSTQPVSATSSTSAAPASAKPTVTRQSLNGLPLSRYTGEWVFPQRGLFYGPPPESVTLIVQEDNGRLRGTLEARFEGRFAASAGVDPALRFEFQGPLQQSRSQSLPLETAETARGTIELIPGSAFNLLEVTFQTEPKSNKVISGNFILVKR